MIKQILLFGCLMGLTHFSFGQDRKLIRCYENILNKDYPKAEEIISEISNKPSEDPKLFFLISKLFGSVDYSKYNIDSCFIYYSTSTELLSKQGSKELETICKDFNFCLYDSRRLKDSIATGAFESYKKVNSIERMEEFKMLYEGTSSIQVANVFIEDLHYQSAQQ